MARMRKVSFEREYVQVPNETAMAPEKRTETTSISLAALGLITNLWSYNVEEWELHKTELYKRYEYNAKTSVTNAWNELVAARYIVEYRYPNGKGWEYVYYYNVLPYTDKQVEFILEMATEEHGKIYDVRLSTSDAENQQQGGAENVQHNPRSINRAYKKEELKKDFKKENNIYNKDTPRISFYNWLEDY